MEDSYPYPRLNEEGYELEVVEQADGTSHPFLSYPIPDEETRFAVSQGDTVKLIFRYRDPVEKNGQTFTAEHMWVEVMELKNNCIVGRLDSSPQFSKILESDATIRFHPKHIVRFWADPETG